MPDINNPSLENENNKLQKGDIQAFSEVDILDNGNTYHNINDLPPEARLKVQQAMEKLRSNPGLYKMIQDFSDVAKDGQTIGAIPIKDPRKAELVRELLQQMSAKNGKNLDQQTLNPSEKINTDNASTVEQLNQVSSLRPNAYAQLNQQRNLNPTFNPHVKGDKLRRNILITALIFIAGYLIFRFGFNGQLPF